MKYAVEMSSCAMIYIPILIKIGSTIQKMIGGEETQAQARTYTQAHTHTHTHKAWRPHKLTFIFQNKESSLARQQ
jgi:hypothetical protein